MFPKKKRLINKAMLAEVARRGCAVKFSRHVGKVQAHHIKTRGAGGDDVEPNLVPLCAGHHTDIHAMGIQAFLQRYGSELSVGTFDKLMAHEKGRS